MVVEEGSGGEEENCKKLVVIFVGAPTIQKKKTQWNSRKLQSLAQRKAINKEKNQ